MDYTKLGNTDIEISKICVGCMSFGKAGIMHDWTLDEEQTAEENSPLTKNTVPFVHQKKPEAFRSWFSFHIPSKPHTEIYFFHPIFFYPDCLFWKFCSLRSQNNQRTRLCLRLRLANRQVLLAWLSLRPISISQLHTLLCFHL